MTSCWVMRLMVNLRGHSGGWVLEGRRSPLVELGFIFLVSALFLFPISSHGILLPLSLLLRYTNYQIGLVVESG